VEQLNALQVGMASVDLGAGRERKEDSIDHSVGIIVHKKVGDAVAEGDVTFTLHANDKARLERAKRRLEHTIVYRNGPTAPLPTFYDTISA
jgi:pyrimidine-nucleoside phosphorylase